MRGDERAAAHGGQRKPEKGSGDDRLPARPAEHEAKARGQLGVAEAHLSPPEQAQGEVEAGENGGTHGGAGEEAGVVPGERGHGQQGEGASEGGGGQTVREAVDGYVSEGERHGDQGQPSQCGQLPAGRDAGGH